VLEYFISGIRSLDHNVSPVLKKSVIIGGALCIRRQRLPGGRKPQ
jgi:hypothetical protein